MEREQFVGELRGEGGLVTANFIVGHCDYLFSSFSKLPWSFRSLATGSIRGNATTGITRTGR